MVYIGVYLVLAYIERSFSTVCYFCWSVNCISRVSKFHNFFWHAWKLRQGLYLRAFNTVIYGKLNSNFLVLFFSFFHKVCKLHESFFSHFLLVSKLFQLSLSSRRCPEVWALIYIRDLSVLLFMESLIHTVCTYSDFSLVWKLYKFGPQIMPLISDHLRFMGSVDIGGF